jgi:hypothetical protein
MDRSKYKLNRDFGIKKEKKYYIFFSFTKFNLRIIYFFLIFKLCEFIWKAFF